MTIQNNVVLVERVALEQLIQRVEKLEKQLITGGVDSHFRKLVESYATGGVLTAKSVGAIMNWSPRTMYRRREDGTIPFIQDGKRYVITVDDFLMWHSKNYKV